MKHQKPHETSPGKSKKRESIRAFKKYIDGEVTLIHEDLEELKNFLSRHAAMPAANELQTDDKNLDEYYHSANDLFRQMALESGDTVPIETKWYETFILRKKTNPSLPSSAKNFKKQ
jgi:hypothetical protein